jgi:hypothetical protein
LSTRFGSNVGDDAITFIAPVRGSIATTAPQLLPSSCCASACAPGLIVNTTLFPCTVAPPSLSSVRWNALLKFVFAPVR